MSQFLQGNQLNTKLEELFDQADEQLILISPYIKLHDRLSSVLKKKLNNHKLKLILVFGKNESNMAKSLKEDDFTFFKQFPNVEIRYEKRLHAKFYANESSCILTSMNLYSYSQDVNIEAGVLFDATIIGELSSLIRTSVEDTAMNYFQTVIDQSQLLFQKIPVYESAMLGLTKTYKNSTVSKDDLTDFFAETLSKHRNYADSFSKQSITTKKMEQQREQVGRGYCIRSGVPIPFNTRQPFSDSAFQSWKRHSNNDYKEKYCHFSGEASNGATSFTRPILNENWAKAKAVHKF
jgi:hypothetical protein